MKTSKQMLRHGDVKRIAKRPVEGNPKPKGPKLIKKTAGEG